MLRPLRLQVQGCACGFIFPFCAARRACPAQAYLPVPPCEQQGNPRAVQPFTYLFSRISVAVFKAAGRHRNFWLHGLIQIGQIAAVRPVMGQHQHLAAGLQQLLAQDVRNRLTAIEHAAESETNARTAADTDLQSDMNTVKTTLTVKTACHFGTYTGDGTEKRTIMLGYHPKAVLVLREGCYTGYSSAIYGGLASEDVPLMYGDSVGLGVTADGFQLLNSRNCALNLSGYKYSFAVFA